MKRIDVVDRAKRYAESGFSPAISGSACCHFVTKVLQDCGSSLGIINYVPYLTEKCSKVGKAQAQAGDLIVFDQTYDAVAPAGIGPEDDQTHIGIWLGDNKFVDYGGGLPGSGGKARISTLAGYWAGLPYAFYVPPGYESQGGSHQDDGSTLRNIKFFYHPAVPHIKIVIDGKEEWIDELMLSVRTRSNRELLMMSHGFENAPFLNLDNVKGKVKAVEWHVKWELGSGK